MGRPFTEPFATLAEMQGRRGLNAFSPNKLFSSVNSQDGSNWPNAELVWAWGWGHLGSTFRLHRGGEEGRSVLLDAPLGRLAPEAGLK